MLNNKLAASPAEMAVPPPARTWPRSITVRGLSTWFAGLVAALAACPGLSAAEPPRFEWKDGDRVVLVGDTLIERDQSFGYLETLVTLRNPDKAITFRNLGWSADTALGLSRAAFDPPPLGFARLKEHVLALKPTVLIVGYGMAASFDGDRGLPAFVSSLNTLLDSLGPAKARLVLLSPIAHEDLGRPLPDPSAHNADLKRYRDAIEAVAKARDAWFVDLYEPTLSAHDYGIDPLTYNGIHLSAYGSWHLASVLDADLRQAKREPGWGVRADVKAGRVQGQGTKVVGTETTPESVRFEATDATLPTPRPPAGAPEDVVSSGRGRAIRVGGLKPGRYSLYADGKPVATATAGQWAGGVTPEVSPDDEQVNALRTAVNEKNRLYFYRWRPQNETYLFGFRKHEQGNNAREIPLFDPLVETKESEIATLKRPVTRRYELRRDADAKTQ